jgi:RND family efflux transporter MFP subunit
LTLERFEHSKSICCGRLPALKIRETLLMTNQSRTFCWALPRVVPMAAGLAVAIAMAGCHGDEAPAPQAQTKPVAATPTVTVTAAALAPWPQTVRVQGSLMGDEQAVVGAKVAGRIKEVLVDLGSMVRSGDVLSRLDSEDFDLRVAQADAQLTQARAALGLSPDQPDSQLDRLKSPPVRQEKAILDQAQFEVDRAQRLVQQKIVTIEELQQKEAALNVAKARYAASLNGVDEKIALLAVRRAELSLAKRQQTDAVTLAPFVGIVQERHVAPGVYVNVGHPIVTLVRTDPLRFHAGVPERQATAIAVGQPVMIQVDGRPEAIEARVTRISPALEMSSRTLVIEADVPNPDQQLRTGLFAEADVVVDPSARVLSIPEAAISEFAGVEKVWVVADSVAKEHRIRTGRRHADRVEIIEGLKEGDTIIADADQGHSGQVAIAASSTSPMMQLGGGE